MSSPPRDIALVALLMALATVSAAAATATADIDAQDSQSIPEQEITFDGDTYYPSMVSVHDPGETLTMDITVSDESLYKIPIYNTNEQIVDQKKRYADATIEFDLSGYASGTYMVTVSQDGSFLTIYPLLVRGYRVTVDAPSEASADGTVTVEATVEQLRGDQLEYVEIVISDGEHRVRKQATLEDGTYVATLDVGSLPAGEYEVYAPVRGPTEAFGGNEFLGVNTGQSLTLTTATSTPTTTDDGSGGTGGDGGNTTSTATTSSTSTSSSTATTSGTPSQTTTTQTESSPASATVATTRSSTTAGTPSSSSTPRDVVTPASSTSPTTSGQPGFGVMALVASLTALVALRWLVVD